MIITYISHFFLQLAFNLSNGVTDTLEFSSILFYSKLNMSLYTQMVGKMPHRLNGWLKIYEIQKCEL